MRFMLLFLSRNGGLRLWKATIRPVFNRSIAPKTPCRKYSGRVHDSIRKFFGGCGWLSLQVYPVCE
jgi:hypothetical protein